MANNAQQLNLSDFTIPIKKIGIHALHLPSLKTIEYNAHDPFLLCSTYKLPMAIAVLRKAEKNELQLTDQISITAQELRPSMISTLNQLDYTTPVHMSVLNLLAFMLQESCNSATDALLKLIGGTRAVMQCLQEIGITDLRVDRTTFELLCDLEGIKTRDSLCTLAEFKNRASQVTASQLQQAREELNSAPYDKGTAFGMTQLLRKIAEHKILSDENTTLLLKLMRRCKIGSQRMMGLLPPGTPVAHKTGTANGYVHDIGMIDLKNGCIVLAVFLQNEDKSLEKNERVIAEVSRRIYDYFLFSL